MLHDKRQGVRRFVNEIQLGWENKAGVLYLGWSPFITRSHVSAMQFSSKNPFFVALRLAKAMSMDIYWDKGHNLTNNPFLKPGTYPRFSHWPLLPGRRRSMVPVVIPEQDSNLDAATSRLPHDAPFGVHECEKASCFEVQAFDLWVWHISHWHPLLPSLLVAERRMQNSPWKRQRTCAVIHETAVPFCHLVTSMISRRYIHPSFWPVQKARETSRKTWQSPLRRTLSLRAFQAQISPQMLKSTSITSSTSQGLNDVFSFSNITHNPTLRPKLVSYSSTSYPYYLYLPLEVS